MDIGSYASTISAVRRLCEAARNLPPNGLRGPHSAELVSALQAVDADLKKLQAGEDALRRTEQQLTQAAWDTQLHYLCFRQLFELSPDGCSLTDTRGVIRQASQAAASLLRCRKEFLLDKPLAFFAVGETRNFYAYLDQLNHEATNGQYWEVCLKPPKGKPVYVDLTAVAIPDGDNRSCGFLWLLRNMTERKLAQQTLQAEKDFANSLIETAQAIIFVLDNRGRILRSNQFLHALSGYDADQLRAHDWVDLFLPEADRAAFRTMLSEALRGGKSQGGTYGLVTKDQGIRLVAWSAQSLMPRVGEGAALLLVGHDVTEAHETQTRALKMERLAAIGRAVTTLTHESRNALQRGEVCLEILKLRLKGRPEDLELVARIQRAQNDLIRLYEEVRSYGGPIQIDRSRCDVAAVWREAWDQVASLFPNKEALLSEEIAGVELHCDVDHFRLVQVFRNLLENAFAACPGTVRITIACQQAVLARRPALQIAVRDNGPGLNEEQRRHIFEPFYTTKSRGTGLGTSIARRIVEAHGGQIAVGDTARPGTEIVLTLPRNST